MTHPAGNGLLHPHADDCAFRTSVELPCTCGAERPAAEDVGPLAEQIRRELVCGCIEANDGLIHPFCRGAELAARLVESAVETPRLCEPRGTRYVPGDPR